MNSSRCTKALLLGAYYYTWYGVGEQWEVFPHTFEPSLGLYNSASNATIDVHHRWGREACLDFLAISWGGDGTRTPKKHRPPLANLSCSLTREEKGTEQHVRPHCQDMEGLSVEMERGKTYPFPGFVHGVQWWSPSGDIDMLIQRHLEVKEGLPVALMYELRDVLGVGENQGQVDLEWGDNPKILEHHLLYAARTYFSHPSYLKIAGCPVLFLYTLRDYVNFEKPLAEAFRKVEHFLGTPLYIIGDAIWWAPEPSGYSWSGFQTINVSALTAYNLYDDSQKPKMGMTFASETAWLYAQVAEEANTRGMQVVPYISPGYDDRNLRGEDRPYVLRHHGVQYKEAWQQMTWFTRCQHQSGNPIVMLNSFNEWHEGTQVEPSEQFGRSFIDWTREHKNAVEEYDFFDCHALNRPFRSGALRRLKPKNLQHIARFHWKARLPSAHAINPTGSDAALSHGNTGSPGNEQDVLQARVGHWHVREIASAITIWTLVGYALLSARKLTSQQISAIGLVIVLVAFGLVVVMSLHLPDSHLDQLAFQRKYSEAALRDRPVALWVDEALLNNMSDIVDEYQLQTLFAVSEKAREVCVRNHLKPSVLKLIEKISFAPYPGCIHDMMEACKSKFDGMVEEQYRLIFGRNADRDGHDHYCKLLEKRSLDLAKLQKALMSSEEFEHRMRAQEDIIFQGREHPPSSQEKDLMRKIYKAYIVILGRNPDPDGLRHYLQRVLDGTQQFYNVEVDMMNSEEARAYRARLAQDEEKRKLLSWDQDRFTTPEDLY